MYRLDNNYTILKGIGGGGGVGAGLANIPKSPSSNSDLANRVSVTF